jgi:tRNA-Thr(GGU) m(6)t(6)A37 methyltransferase TsaA
VLSAIREGQPVAGGELAGRHADENLGGKKRAPRHGPSARAERRSMSESRFEVKPIGAVESSLTDPIVAPKQGHEGAPDAWLVFDPAVLEGLEGIWPGDRVIVLTWLHLARRDLLRVHPRDDVTNPMQGVFNTRSADRPNPIGLHEVEVVAIDGARMHVRNLEAVDGTPVVDLKPVLTRAPNAGPPE